MDVCVIGGGAAGFFAALSIRQHHPGAHIVLLEKGTKLLSKVRISGGGRCNVTHHCTDIKRLAKHYPRGGNFLRRSFREFSATDTIDWFQARSVRLKTEEDGRMFPVTDDSATIVDLLMEEARRAGIQIRLDHPVRGCSLADGRFILEAGSSTIRADHLIAATGGHPKHEAYQWLGKLGHSIVPPVPSLFTFNMPGEGIRDLMGVVADPVHLRIIGTDLEATGPLLITHWGMSGPAILKLSAWGARVVHDLGYHFTLRVNWLGGTNEEQVRRTLIEAISTSGRKQIMNASPFKLPKRLWQHLLVKAGIPADQPVGGLPRKERDRLTDLLTNDRYQVKGKTTFKEEFVTAGGVSLEEVDPVTMRSLKVPGLYFAGEVLDIDGITGGFNFQAAWTTGFIAGRLA